jgi:hypothetical protein
MGTNGTPVSKHVLYTLRVYIMERNMGHSQKIETERGNLTHHKTKTKMKERKRTVL